MAINDVVGEGGVIYEIFLMNFWVIILFPVFVH